METLSRINDMRFEFNIIEEDEFLELRKIIREKIDNNLKNVPFLANLFVKINNTIFQVLDEIDDHEIKPHVELIKRVINNFVFSKKYRYLGENFVLIANSYKEINLYLMKHRHELNEIFDPKDIELLRAIIIEISKVDFGVERRL